MNILKSALAMLAFLAVGIGTGLLVRVGIGATAERGVDIQWFDSELVGASAGMPPHMPMASGCDDCLSVPAVAGIGLPPADEVRRIAERLDSHTVPLFVATGEQITQLDPAMLDARIGTSGSL